MAINFKVVLEKAKDVQGLSNDLFSIVGEAQVAKYNSQHSGSKAFTSTDKTAIKAKYFSTLSTLKAAINAMPTQ